MNKNVLLLLPDFSTSSPSVREVINYVKNYWQNIKDCNLSVYINNGDFKKLSSAILKSEVVVCLDHQYETLLFLKNIRISLGHEFQLIFYLLGMTGIGLWPLFRSGLLEAMTSHDIFVGSCQGDERRLALLLENYTFKLQEFAVDIPHLKTEGTFSKNLLHIGRIVDEKNIIGLLKVLRYLINIDTEFNLSLVGDFKESSSIFKKKSISPSLNSALSYKEEIFSFIKKNGIEKHVIFKGELSHDEIAKLVSSYNYTFISLSLNYEENFNLSCYRALKLGMCGILSNIGGHENFYSSDFSNVKIINVQDFSNDITKDEIADLIVKINFNNKHKFNPLNFSAKNILNQEASQIPNEAAKRIKPRDLCLKISNQVEILKGKAHLSPVFANEHDPIYKKLMDAYLFKK